MSGYLIIILINIFINIIIIIIIITPIYFIIHHTQILLIRNWFIQLLIYELLYLHSIGYCNRYIIIVPLIMNSIDCSTDRVYDGAK